MDFDDYVGDYVEENPRGWKTQKVLDTLEQRAMNMREIKVHTGMELRTLHAILYALQHQGRVSPIDSQTETKRSRMSFALVGGDVKPLKIVRQKPFVRRRRTPGVGFSLDPSSGDLPSWCMPRMPKMPPRAVGLVHTCFVDFVD